MRDEINRQVELIRRADVRDLPRWLGPPSHTLLTIDYRRFKPIGFYPASESLQNYFRAVRWLQSIPLRGDRDNELTAIGLLGYATMEKLAEIQFRVLSAFRLPDSLMLARTTKPGKLPSGLAVAVLLGSDFAPARRRTVRRACGSAWRNVC